VARTVLCGVCLSSTIATIIVIVNAAQPLYRGKGCGGCERRSAVASRTYAMPLRDRFRGFAKKQLCTYHPPTLRTLCSLRCLDFRQSPEAIYSCCILACACKHGGKYKRLSACKVARMNQPPPAKARIPYLGSTSLKCMLFGRTVLFAYKSSADHSP
jgi:hypothetical protein